MTRPGYILAMCLLLSTPAWAACPPQAPGTIGQDIKDNESRLLCLQRELAESANRMKLQMDIDALQRQIGQMQLQQKLNTIAVPVIVIPTVPVVTQPML